MVDRHPQVGYRQEFDGQVGWFIVRKVHRAMLARLAFALKICRQLPCPGWCSEPPPSYPYSTDAWGINSRRYPTGNPAVPLLSLFPS